MIIGLTLAAGWFLPPFISDVMAQYSDSIDFDKYDEPRIHMERLMRVHLIEFGLPIRLLCRLESIGIRTLGNLLEHTRDEIMAISQVGATSIMILDKFLQYHNLFWKKQKGPHREP